MGYWEYILKVSLTVFAAWLFYRVFIRHLTFFHWNRAYLTGSVLFSFVLPLIRLSWAGNLIPEPLQGGIDWTYFYHIGNGQTAGPLVTSSVKGVKFLTLMYLTGLLGVFSLFVYRYARIRRIARNASLIRSGKIKIFVHKEPTGSFTLFRRIYLDRYAMESRMVHVYRHEAVHATGQHTLDVLFLSLACTLLWFNPFIYLMLRHARENHEYMADERAMRHTKDKEGYLHCLRDESFRRVSYGLASHFRNSTIVKRIQMLTGKKTLPSGKWIYLLIIPMTCLLFISFRSNGEHSLMTPAGRILDDVSPSVFPLPDEYREKVSWGFNETRIHPFTHKKVTHEGLDIPAPSGTPVYAAGNGTVIKAENLEGWGNLVVVDHGGGMTTFYAHLDEFNVKSGDRVKAGQKIASVGSTGQSTGPHLHYEVRKDDEPVDPSKYYSSE